MQESKREEILREIAQLESRLETLHSILVLSDGGEEMVVEPSEVRAGRILLGAFEEFPILVSRLDGDMVVRMAFGNALERVGQTPEQLIGNSVEHLDPDALSFMTPVSKNGEKVIFESSGNSSLGPYAFLHHLIPDPVYDGGVLVLTIDVTERKVAEDQAIANAESFIQLAQNLPDTIARLDRDLTHTYVNPVTERLFGRESSEVVGRTLGELLAHTGLARDFEQAARSVLRTGESRSHDWQLGDRSFNTVLAPEHYTGDKTDSLLLVTREVTPLVEARESARAREKELRLITDTVPVAMFRADTGGTLTYGNARLARVLDMPNEALRGHGWLRAFDEDTRSTLLDIWRLRPRGFDALEARTRDQKRHLVISSRPVLTEDDEVMGFVGYIQDVTEERKAVEQLMESEERLTNALSLARMGMYEVGFDRTVIHFSPEMYRIFGFMDGSAPLDPMKLKAMIHPDDVERVASIFRKSLKDHGGASAEFRIVRKDGTERSLATWSKIIQDERGQPARVRGLVQDITEMRELQERVRLSEMMKAVTELAGGMAHEFNNMLVPISANAELLAMELDEEHEHQMSAEHIVEAAARCSALTSQLLVLARPEQGEATTVSANVLLSNAIRLMKPNVGSSYRIVEQYSATGMIEVDPGTVQTAVVSLLSNAQLASEGGGNIVIATEDITLDHNSIWNGGLALSPGDYVQITVEDFGCGMVPETARRAFEPFFSTRRASGANGLGLSTVWTTVRAQGGTVVIDTEPGRGTRVEIYLPSVEKKSEEPRFEGSSAPVARRSMAPTILVVDDEALVRHATRRILERNGFAVLAGASGMEAVEILESSKSIDLVLLDIVMPGLAGVELFERMRELRPHLPIVVASGFTSGREPRELPARGAAGYIRKPFGVDDLVRSIQAVFAQDDEHGIRLTRSRFTGTLPLNLSLKPTDLPS